jgi:cation diffusion facilitator CzcD-associated flavoprotein CzcO/amino acid transporter
MVYPSRGKRLLSTGMVVFLVVSAAAPLTAMAGNMPIGLSLPAGLGMPMAFVVVTAILACFAAGYAELSRAVKSGGAFYTYIGRGLGRPAGVVAAYCAVLAYAAMSVGLAAAFGYFGSVLFDQLGMKVSWLACAAAGLGVIAIMGYLALDLSARALAFFMSAEFLVLGAFDVCVLLAKGWAAFPAEVWRPANYLRLDFGAILPFAVTSFIGIEAAALYGEETRQPQRSIPAATFIALAAVALFYFLTVWIMIGAAGADHVQAFAKERSGDFLFDLTKQYGGDALTTFTGLFFVTSLLAAYLALHNAASKYIFALAADGLLPAALTQVHSHYRSPIAASVLMTLIEIGAVIGLGLAGVSPYLGIASGAVGLGTVAIIAMQCVCAFAVVGFFRGAARANRLTTLVLPAVGGVGLVLCLIGVAANYRALTGSDNPIVNALPLVLVPVVAGALWYARWLARTRPAKYAAIGRGELRSLPERLAMRIEYRRRYCIVGAGPAGLIMARALSEEGVPFDVYERNPDVGGIWDLDHSGTPMYETAHFISSKWCSYFYGFPFPDNFPDYPSHRQILDYIRAFARAFDLYRDITFNTEVKSACFVEGVWRVELSDGRVIDYAGLVAAPGVTWHPRLPEYPTAARFAGEMRHSSSYRSPTEFQGKNVLIVGAGNSGVDIACDAARYARKAYLSVRRGYRFVPKHIFGVPTDVLINGMVDPPRGVPITLDPTVMLDRLNGDLTRLGLPKPDHDALTSHPIMNTQVLHHLAHGDLAAKPDIAEFRERSVVFKDGSEEPVDLVLFATGYDYKLPFLDEGLFEWRSGRPQLYLNLIHRKLPGLYVLGFAEFADGAYRRFEEMARVIVADIHARESGVRRDVLDRLRESHFPDLRGGKAYVDSPRHAAYVDKDTYRDVLMSLLRDLGWPAPTDDGLAMLKARAPSGDARPSRASHVASATQP